jgi:photosystem II stability/assembly factor-like uncharacterized protein
MILVGTDDGIYRWYEDAPWLTFHSLQGRAIVGLASPGAGVIAAVDDAGRLWETTTNGLAWREVPRPAETGRPSALAIFGALPQLILATRGSGLFGRAVGAPVAVEFEPPIAAIVRRAWSRASGTAVAEAPARLPAAADGLKGWIRLTVPPAPSSPIPPEIRRLERTSQSWFAAVAGAGLWKSIDAGSSWVQCPGLPSEVFAIRPIPGKDGAVALGTADGCWTTLDDGENWTSQSNGLARHVRALEVRPGDAKYLLAGAADTAPGTGGVAAADGLGFRLFESKDAGKTWSPVTRGFPARLEYDTIDDIRWDPAAAGYAIIALESGECWRTRSGGDWWEPIARQTRAARVLCAVI